MKIYVIYVEEFLGCIKFKKQNAKKYLWYAIFLCKAEGDMYMYTYT